MLIRDTATTIIRYLLDAITFRDVLMETFSLLTSGVMTSLVFLNTMKNIGVEIRAKITATIVYALPVMTSALPENCVRRSAAPKLTIIIPICMPMPLAAFSFVRSSLCVVITPASAPYGMFVSV